MRRVVGVIPARWQSSRFPGKPLVDILGKSLIQRAFENASQCTSLDALIVATDDQRIFDHVQQLGGQVCMTPPECATGTDRTWEVIKLHFPDAEIVVNIQGDEPCLDPHVIDRLVSELQTRPEVIMATPVSLLTDLQMAQKTSVVKCVFDLYGRALYFSRSLIPFAQRSGHAPAYYRHLGVYAFRRSALEQYVSLSVSPLQESEDLEQLKMLEHGLSIHVCVVEDQAAGVDTPADVKTVEEFICQTENTYSSQAALSPR